LQSFYQFKFTIIEIIGIIGVIRGYWGY